jgi:rRNA maturation endonuclease Nob1
MLEGFDEENRKFLEAGTGGLHTKERCQEAKAKLEAKNDHGNEESKPLTLKHPENIGTATIKVESPKEMYERYVDHTQGQKLKLKVLTSTEAEGLSLAYNTFGESHNIKFSQYQIAGSLYTIAVWYSEEKA